jgi:hypothetical protein
MQLGLCIYITYIHMLRWYVAECLHTEQAMERERERETREKCYIFYVKKTMNSFTSPQSPHFSVIACTRTRDRCDYCVADNAF